MFRVRRVSNSAAALLCPGSRAFLSLSLALRGKVHPFRLADIGEGIPKVKITKWLVKPDDVVKRMSPLCDVESDKASVQIPTPFDGIVRKLYYEVGADAIVGQPLVDIETDSPQAAGKQSAGETQSKAEAPKNALRHDVAVPAEKAASGKAVATPAVRKIAKEHQIDIATVAGSGKDGRVMKADLLAVIDGVKQPTPTPVATGADRIIVLEGVRKAMAKSMTAALSIPAFSSLDEIELSRLIDLRDDLRPVVQKRAAQVKLTFMPFFIKAASLALREFPEINAHVDAQCTQLEVKAAHNIGFAFDTPKGLIVPNVKGCESKSIFQIAVALDEIIQRGKSGVLGLQDLAGGTFTLSNVGTIGSTVGIPVIFPPQVAIGALGSLQKLPRFNADGGVYAAKIVQVAWSADHRVVDGATMVRFGNLFKSLLENPSIMLLDAI